MLHLLYEVNKVEILAQLGKNSPEQGPKSGTTAIPTSKIIKALWPFQERNQSSITLGHKVARPDLQDHACPKQAMESKHQ